MEKIKKILSAVLTGMIILSSTVGTQAAQVADRQGQLQSCAETMQITTDEIINFKENLYHALDEFNHIPLDEKNNITMVQISDNLYLEVEPITPEESVERGNFTTLSNKAYVKNVLGQTLITLTAVASFIRSGTTVTPHEAYGLYDSILYSIDCSETHLSVPGSVGSATVVYKCVFNIGIEGWIIPFFSANISGTIYCDYNGNPNSTWLGL